MMTEYLALGHASLFNKTELSCGDFVKRQFYCQIDLSNGI